MAPPRREADLRALLAPLERDVTAHLVAHAPRVRACLALALAADLVADALPRALDTIPGDDAARLIELAGRIDGVVAELWPGSGAPPGGGGGGP